MGSNPTLANYFGCSLIGRTGVSKTPNSGSNPDDRANGLVRHAKSTGVLTPLPNLFIMACKRENTLK